MKVDDDCWIPAPEAVQRIRARLSVSVGRAQKILSEAYASAEVRRSVAVGPDEDGELRHAHNDISWTDLKGWLDANCPAAQRSTKKNIRTAPNLERAKDAINAVFPDGVPAAVLLPNNRLIKKVSEWMDNQNPKILSVSDSTILRAAGRRH